MTQPPQLNGSDYLMLGFDHELRARGFAGNSCQVILELDTAVPPAALRQRLDELARAHPILGARPGGLFRPQWKLPRRTQPAAEVSVHSDGPDVASRIFNRPLDIWRGELYRFDLVERAGGRMDLLFTWAHALMDAPAAEHFLAVAGRPGQTLPGPEASPARAASRGLSARWKLARKNLAHIHELGGRPPRAIAQRFSESAPVLHYRVEKFSAAETAAIRAHSARLCGLLGEAQYHAAVAAVELHRLHGLLGASTPSYVIPVPVGLRPKGAVAPLFSNQVAMFMLQFLPEHLGSVADAVATVKAQTTHTLREGLLEGGNLCAELARVLPLPLFMALLKHGLRGEICSLFYGNTAAVSPLLTEFLGANIRDVTHVAAVTPAPGLGTIFHSFRGGLRVTVIYSGRVLREAEAADFSARLRARLLNP